MLLFLPMRAFGPEQYMFIILEKADDRAKRWNLTAEFTKTDDPLVWSDCPSAWRVVNTDNGVGLGGGEVFLLAQEHPDTPALMDRVCAIVEHDLHVFCHYGNDLAPVDVEPRWRQLAQHLHLSDETVAKLRSKNGGLPPIPFSHGQRAWRIGFPEEANITKLAADFQRLSRSLLLGCAAGAVANSTPLMCCLLEPEIAGELDCYGVAELVDLAFEALPDSLNSLFNDEDLKRLEQAETKLVESSRSWRDALFELREKFRANADVSSEDLRAALEFAKNYSRAVTSWIEGTRE